MIIFYATLAPTPIFKTSAVAHPQVPKTKAVGS
jgi:hypothetical protein